MSAFGHTTTEELLWTLLNRGTELLSHSRMALDGQPYYTPEALKQKTERFIADVAKLNELHYALRRAVKGE